MLIASSGSTQHTGCLFFGYVRAGHEPLDSSDTGALHPMFDALPKHSSRRPGFDGVHYMLHQLVVLRHGWFVYGLDTTGDAWDISSPTGTSSSMQTIMSTVFLQGRGN